MKISFARTTKYFYLVFIILLGGFMFLQCIGEEEGDPPLYVPLPGNKSAVEGCFSV